jgi:hypothetical protein
MRPRRAPEPSKLFEAELRIHQVSKNNARRFRFITEKQSFSSTAFTEALLNEAQYRTNIRNLENRHAQASRKYWPI